MPYQHTDLRDTIIWMQFKKKLRKTFCCYNCLDFQHAQIFFQVFVTCFPSSLKQEQCLEKITNSGPTASNLHNLFSTQYSCSQELEKSNSHLEKKFSRQIETIIATKYYFLTLPSNCCKAFKKVKFHYSKLIFFIKNVSHQYEIYFMLHTY